MNVRAHILFAFLMSFLITMHAEATGQQSPTGTSSGYRPQNGKPHSDFELPNIENGEKVALAQFRGKKLLLLHFASW